MCSVDPLQVDMYSSQCVEGVCVCVGYGWYQKAGRKFEKGNMGIRIPGRLLSASHNIESLKHQILTVLQHNSTHPASIRITFTHEYAQALTTQAREPTLLLHPLLTHSSKMCEMHSCVTCCRTHSTSVSRRVL